MDKQKVEILLIIVILLGIGLRLYQLDNQSLWIDEVMRLNIAMQSSFADLISANYKWDSQPPFYHILTKAWMKFGEGDFWLRVLPLIFGVMTIPLIYALATNFYNEQAGLLAALLLSISPFHIWHSQDANMYSLLIFLTVLSFYCTLRILKDKRSIWSIGYIFAILFGLYTHYYFASVVVAANLFVFLSYKKYSYRLRYWIFLQIGIGFLILPDLWFFHKLTQAFYETGVQHRDFSLWALPYTFFVFANGYSFGPSINELRSLSINFIVGNYTYIIAPVFLLFIVLIVAGFLKLRFHHREKIWFIITMILTPVLFVIAGALIIFPQYNVRYAFGGFPVFYLLLSMGILYFKNKIYRYIVVMALVIISFFSLGNYYFNAKYYKDDSKAVAQHIKYLLQENDAILVCQIKTPFEYYFGRKENVYGVYENDLDSVDFYKKTGHMLSKYDRLWLVYARPWAVDPDGNLIQFLNGIYKKEEERSFPGVKLFLFSKQNTNFKVVS